MSARPAELRNVEVRVRVRPGSKTSVLRTAPKELATADKKWTFDRVYAPSTRQEEIYDEAVRPLVEATLDGYNSTIFAYGQTGSGKTYTMGTGTETLSHNEGVVPRALRDLFAQETSGLKIRGSYVEVYNEELRDLLDAREKKLHIREDAARGIFVDGCVEEPLASIGDAMKLLARGAAARATKATKLNNRSSRSHAILTIIVERRQHLVEDSRGDVRASTHVALVRSKIHCVDLAGSERCKRSGARGDRLKEGIHINGGLLALGKVISALCDREEGKQAHAPYRESKLTRLLQDSLGGTARTCMLACVSPDAADLPETLTTLGYASRAKRVRNAVVANATVVMAPQGPSHLELENSRLRAQLAVLANKPPPPPTKSIDDFGDGPDRLAQAVCEGNRRLSHVKVALESLVARGGLDQKTREAVHAVYNECGGTNGDPPLGELVTGGPVRAVLELQAAVDQRDAKLRCLETQLREARSDLQRDEEIFSIRARELKDCKDALSKQARDASDVKAHLIRAEARADATEQVLKSARSRLSTDAMLENRDPLNITSKLRASCLRAESKAQRDLDKERASLEHQQAAQKKLQVLEAEISTKEACIASLATSEREATRAVQQYQQRVVVLEREAEQLRSLQSPTTMKAKKSELAELKMQDLGQVEALRRASERRICQLHEEVTSLKSQRDAARPATARPVTARPVTARTRDKLEKRAHRWLRRRLDAVTRPPTAGSAACDPFDALRTDVTDLPQKHCAAALTEALRQLVTQRLRPVVTPPAGVVQAYESKIDMLLRELHKHEAP